jgi:hypothetical protein
MMSTAVAMTVSTELESVRSGTPDRGGSENVTFAQSFGERAGLPVGIEGKNITRDAATELPEGKSTGSSKSFNELSAASGATKGKAIDGQTASELSDVGGGTKNLSEAKNSVVSAAVSDEERSGAAAKRLPPAHDELQNTLTKNVVAANVSQTTVATAGIVKNSPTSGEAEVAAETPSTEQKPLPAAVDSKDVNSVSDEGAAAAPDRTLKAGDDTELPIQLPIQKETVPTGNVEEMAVGRKTGKTQEHATGSKVAAKTIGTTENEKGVKAESPAITNVQGAIVVPVQSSANGDVPRSEGSKALDGDVAAGAPATGRSVAGVSTKAAEGTVRKEIAPGAKGEVEGAGADAKTELSKPAAADFGEDVARAAVAGKGNDGNVQNAVAATASVHAAAGSDGAVVGLAPAVTSGHAAGDMSGIKVQSGEVGGHATGLQAGAEDQDGTGAVAGEMGMSHRTLLATPTALEVGLASGTEGWLKIRAEMTSGGQVNASMSSATAAGQEMLHRELPGLTAYLQTERVAVNTVVVHANASAGAESRLAGGMDREAGGQAQQRGRQEGGSERQSVTGAAPNRAEDVLTYAGLNGVVEDGSLSVGTYAGGGSWLNVRA